MPWTISPNRTTPSRPPAWSHVEHTNRMACYLYAPKYSPLFWCFHSKRHYLLWSVDFTQRRQISLSPCIVSPPRNCSSPTMAPIGDAASVHAQNATRDFPPLLLHFPLFIPRDHATAASFCHARGSYTFYGTHRWSRCTQGAACRALSCILRSRPRNDDASHGLRAHAILGHVVSLRATTPSHVK